jgi:hypothetical protein
VVLRQLAQQWQMNYAERDLFNLAPRIAAALPLIGASDLVVHDLIYASDSCQYCCIFAAEYTRGVVEPHRRETRVMSFREAKEHDALQPLVLTAAPPHLPLLSQYEHLKGIVWCPPAL